MLILRILLIGAFFFTAMPVTCAAASSIAKEQPTPLPAVLGLTLTMRDTTADTRLRTMGYTPINTTFVTPLILRSYSSSTAPFEKVTLQTCSAGGEVIGILLQSTQREQALALAKEKFSLRPGEQKNDLSPFATTQNKKYEKAFAQDAHLTLQVTNKGAELFLFSPSAEAQCRKKLQEACSILQESLATQKKSEAARQKANF